MVHIELLRCTNKAGRQVKVIISKRLVTNYEEGGGGGATKREGGM